MNRLPLHVRESDSPAPASVDALREAVEYAADAFERAGDEHGCDYCRADAAVMRRALEAFHEPRNT